MKKFSVTCAGKGELELIILNHKINAYKNKYENHQITIVKNYISDISSKDEDNESLKRLGIMITSIEIDSDSRRAINNIKKYDDMLSGGDEYEKTWVCEFKGSDLSSDIECLCMFMNGIRNICATCDHVDKFGFCKTCNKTDWECEGHYP